MATYNGIKNILTEFHRRSLEEMQSLGDSIEIGSIMQYGGAIAPAGWLICNGDEVSKITYADLYAKIGDSYGVSTDTTKFKLPDFRDRFPQGANGNLGSNIEAGLPNITGTLKGVDGASSTAYDWGFAVQTGLFTVAKTQSSYNTYGGAYSRVNGKNAVFDASKSDSEGAEVYGKSDTVQPKSVCVNYIIKYSKSTGTPASNVTIDDSKSTNSNVYSAKKVDESISSAIELKKDEYSTTEVKTNKIWIDGKPIYRKVFSGLDFGSTASSWTSTGCSLSYNYNLISAYALRNKAVVNEFSYRITSSNLIQYYGKDYYSNCTYLIVEYTKDTD